MWMMVAEVMDICWTRKRERAEISSSFSSSDSVSNNNRSDGQTIGQQDCAICSVAPRTEVEASSGGGTRERSVLGWRHTRGTDESSGCPIARLVGSDRRTKPARAV